MPNAAQGPTGEDLLELWCSKVDKAQRALLRAIWDAHPHVLTRDQLAETTGYSLTSSSFKNALGTLRSAALVERGATKLGWALASTR